MLQGVDFVAGDGDVADGFAQKIADGVGEAWGDADDAAVELKRVADGGDQFTVSKRLRAVGVEGDVLAKLALLDGEAGQVVDVGGLEAIVTITKQAEDRQATQRPGDVVDEDVLVAKEYGGAEDGMGYAGGGERFFELGFATEIFKWRVLGGVGDADVDDALDASGTGGFEEGQRVLHCLLIGKVTMVEADPVGAIQGRNEFQ